MVFFPDVPFYDFLLVFRHFSFDSVMIFTGICLTVTTMAIPIRKTSNVYDTDTGLVMRLFFLSEKRPFKKSSNKLRMNALVGWNTHILDMNEQF